MRISVVTVCYNSASTISYALQSFFEQSHEDKELIVVDGGSRDATLDIVRASAHGSVTIISEPDRGIYDAMNKGVRNARGDAIGFLNSDDRFHDARVLSDIADGLTKVDIIFGDIDFVSDHRSHRIMRRWRGSDYRRGAFRRGWMPAHPSLYVRRSVMETVGEFNISYKISADYEWMLRAFEGDRFQARYLNRTFVDMQQGGVSNSGVRAFINGNLESLRARRAISGAGIVDLALVAKPLRKIMQFVPR